MYPRSAEYTKHSENLSAVRKGLTQIERAHKEAIRGGSEDQVLVLQRLHLLTNGILAEAALRKLIVDPTGFNDRERQLIWRSRSQIDRWLEAVELAARRHYRVLTHEPIDNGTIGATDFSRYVEIRGLLTDELAPVIEDRNKLAHGQWVWQLKSREENKFKEPQAPPPPNFRTLYSQSRLLLTIADVVRLFATSEPAFDRDYDTLIKKFSTAKATLDGSDYAAFVLMLRSSNKHAGKPVARRS
ncbi:hypothetical protein [Amycolatopsis sp. cg9]|uniref:hypothetical protein n=1 Tax=Amycolatopsis sp. cg9 TaxID=3238801 RepID=UPI0035267495